MNIRETKNTLLGVSDLVKDCLFYVLSDLKDPENINIITKVNEALAKVDPVIKSLEGSKHYSSFYQQHLTLKQFAFTSLNILENSNTTSIDKYFNTMVFVVFKKWREDLNKLLKKNNQNKKPLLGLLTNKASSYDSLSRACQYVSIYYGLDFFVFTPQDIDPSNKTIKGSVLINDQWVNETLPYPDIIYDMIKAKGIKEFNSLYEELLEIPILSERLGGVISKLETYDMFLAENICASHIIPYARLESIEGFECFLRKHKSVIVKPSKSSFGLNVIKVDLNDNNVKICRDGKTETIGLEELKEFVKKIIEYNLVIQKYIPSNTQQGQPFDVRIHLMKNSKGNWTIAKTYPRIGNPNTVTSNVTTGGTVGKWPDFLFTVFGEKKAKKLLLLIEDISKEAVDYIEKKHIARINEVGLDIGICPEGNAWIFEINLNRIDTSFHELEVARAVVGYSSFLLNINEENCSNKGDNKYDE